ncbi:scavenger receptor cysteine-rich type 1 protein M130 [Misgurnus anguillicaudatus]|uniref:scavenger receptor cysteine-rich type 1 protein M130 n=1 Tax=Misgurnus anguillicaudatus TaxID=75329 RepID=UPI003CCFCA21
MLFSTLILFQFLGETLSKPASVRLVNGANACSGRLEILYNGTWGPVCAAQWDSTDATVLCRELGCGWARKAKIEEIDMNQQAWTTDVLCTGYESTLMDCKKDIWGSYSCGGTYAGAICDCDGKVLLRIEVKAGVNANDASMKNALLEEIWKKMKVNETFSLKWKTQSNGKVFQEVPQNQTIVQPCN